MINFEAVFVLETEEEQFAKTSRKAKSDLLDELATKAQTGDKEAQEKLLAKIDRLIIKYIRKYLSNYELFEDCLQQCRWHLLKNLHRYDSSKPFIPWLTIVVRNCTLNFLRDQRKWKFFSFNIGEDDDEEFLPEAEADLPAQVLCKNELFQHLHFAIENLKPHYKRVIEQHYFQMLSCEEIAELENAPVGTVKNRLFKARNSLRGELAALVA